MTVAASHGNLIDDITTESIGRYADALAKSLDEEMRKAYAPTERKTLRRFTSNEAAEFIGMTANNMRQRHNEGSFPEVEMDSRGRRLYSAEDINVIRDIMYHTGKNGKVYRPGRQENDKMQVLSAVNFKGGSSKTTATIHLAQRLALRGYRVLAIDMDPQGSLSTFFGFRPELDFESPDALTIYNAICYEDLDAGVKRHSLRDVIRKTYFPNLDMCPASLELSEYETGTAYALGSSRSRHSIFAVRLREALDEVKDDYDVVLIDCPPQVGFTTLTSLAASTGLLVTIVPSMLDVASMSQFLRLATDTLEAIGTRLGTKPSWQFMKFLITRFEPSDGPQNQMTSYLRHILGRQVLINPMVKSTAISDAGMTQQTIYEVDPKHMVKSTLDRAITSMNAVADEVEEVIQKAWGREWRANTSAT